MIYVLSIRIIRIIFYLLDRIIHGSRIIEDDENVWWYTAGSCREDISVIGETGIPAMRRRTRYAAEVSFFMIPLLIRELPKTLMRKVYLFYRQYPPFRLIHFIF